MVIFRFAPTIRHCWYTRKDLQLGGVVSEVIAGGVEVLNWDISKLRNLMSWTKGSRITRRKGNERLDFIEFSESPYGVIDCCGLRLTLCAPKPFHVPSSPFSSNASTHLSNSSRNRNSPLNRARPSRPATSLRQLLLTRKRNILAPKPNNLRYSDSYQRISTAFSNPDKAISFLNTRKTKETLV